MRNPDCTLCPLHKSAKTVCMDGDGPLDAEVLVIGEAPGRNEDAKGRPFIGDSGKLLKTELAKAGLESVRFTNVVRCRPPDNRPPAPDEIKACRKYLDAEIAACGARYVVTLGNSASKAVAKQTKITQAHGQLVDGSKVKLSGKTIMPAYHPAYALRDPSKLPALAFDLARLRRAIDGEVAGEDDFNYVVVNSPKKFEKFFTDFVLAKEFSFDCETSGLFPWGTSGGIRCLGIGLKETAWVFPLEMPGSPMYGFPMRQHNLVETLVMLAKGKIGIAQNGKFDNNWLYETYGVRFRLDFDTMIAHHLIDENQDHGLKYLARVYCDAPEYDLSTKDKKGGSLHVPNDREKYLEYNARDIWYTLKLYYKFNAILRKDMRLRRLFYHLAMPAARALEEIESVGITIDLAKRDETETNVKAARNESLMRLNEQAGRLINWNSPAQVAKLLYEDLGLSTQVRTGKGAFSTGEAALVDLKGKHPIIEELITYRELEKFLGTYIEGWKEYMHGGRLYLSCKIIGTVTGRYSSRLHQVPRDGTIRNLATAPPGWEFGQADLSQAELRIAAELSGDLELISCFRPGGADVHWRTMLHVVGTGASGEYNELAIESAKELRASPLKPKKELSLTGALEILLAAGHDAAIALDKTWKEARKRGKSINFGFIFGMYENKFIETCKTKYGYEPTFDQARQFRQAYFSLYAGVPKWHEKQKRVVKIDSQVTNLFGRVRRLPGINSSDRELRMECERQAINSPVQGTIGDWKAAAMIEIHETISHDKLKIVGEVHDALLFIFRPEFKHEVLPKVKAVMRKPSLLKVFKIDPRVPMDADIEIGNWGAGKKYEEQKCLS